MKKVFNDYMNDNIKLEKYQMIGIICLIVVMAGIFGWVYEFFFYYLNSGMKTFYWQGGNFLPWINIYATGALLILFFSRKYKKNPLKVFLISIVVTGVLEYISGFLIYHLCNGLRLWDYNVEKWNFGNIDGFICLRSVLFFGISSFFLMYALLPFAIYLSKIMKKKTFMILSISLCSIVLIDEIYNLVIARLFKLPRAYNIYHKWGWKYVSFK